MKKKWALVKISHLVFWMACGVILLVLMVRVSSAVKEKACVGFDLNSGLEAGAHFADEGDIRKIISGEGELSDLIGRPMRDFEVSDIERNIEANPYIRNAEVFADLGGVLHVEVEQRKPVVRVFQQADRGYYIDEQGKKMPLSSRYTERVLTATGRVEPFGGTDSLREETTQGLFDVAQFIYQDEFWRKQIDGIHITVDGEFVLIPKVGRQRIVFGKAEAIEDKFHRLWVFYRKAINQVGWETYKVINLKYTGQVVCEK